MTAVLRPDTGEACSGEETYCSSVWPNHLFVRGPNIGISDSRSKAQYKGDTKNHGLWDPYVYVVFCGPILGAPQASDPAPGATRRVTSLRETTASMRSLILIIIPYVILYTILLRNLLKIRKTLKTMRSLILILILYNCLYKILITNLLKQENPYDSMRSLTLITNMSLHDFI